MYGNWGGNYAYPITAGQLRNNQSNQAVTDNEVNTTSAEEETPEEYYKRKIYSPEWCM